MAILLVIVSVVLGASAFAQTQQPPPLDFSDQLYLFSKSQSKQLDAIKEQMNEIIRHDQAVAAWWQQIWDGLPKKP